MARMGWVGKTANRRELTRIKPRITRMARMGWVGKTANLSESNHGSHGWRGWVGWGKPRIDANRTTDHTDGTDGLGGENRESTRIDANKTTDHTDGTDGLDGENRESTRIDANEPRIARMARMGWVGKTTNGAVGKPLGSSRPQRFRPDKSLTISFALRLAH
jgi:hypothetical protein